MTSVSLGSSLAALPFVTDDLAVRAAVATDRSGLPGAPPRAVAQPRSIHDVQQLVLAAADEGVPVVTRGAGSGVAGGATAIADAVVADMSGMNRIISIDAENRIATVEPGVITAHLDAAAAHHDLRYAPDPASAAISTIGGNIATNAGGLRCVKYGVTRDAVRSLEVVLADGRLLSTGALTVKSVTGYDLTSLFVGSEGTLGIIVGASVALRPLPKAVGTIRASFATVADAAEAVGAVLASGVTPLVLELLDSATVAAVESYVGGSYDDGGPLLIAQTEGAAARAEAEILRDALATTATAVDVAYDDQGAETILAARRAALPAIEQYGAPFIEDIAVPLSRLAEAVQRIEDIAARHRLRIFTFAHAGDGNLHPLIVSEHDSSQVQSAADEIFALALELGGTVSGEHGIGRLKRDWAARELGPIALDVHHAIRHALDPHGLFNAGRAL